MSDTKARSETRAILLPGWAKRMVLTRHTDGEIHVIHNQCAHRGAMVVAEDAGNADEFVCCYHGWTYDTTAN